MDPVGQNGNNKKCCRKGPKSTMKHFVPPGAKIARDM